MSADLWRVLKRAHDLSEECHGAFDVTVGPSNLWRQARRTHRLPDATRLAQAGRSVGYQKMRLIPASRTVELLAPDMRLDLGGIAKGYALDEALNSAKHGIERALVSGGGDMALGMLRRASKDGALNWRPWMSPTRRPRNLSCSRRRAWPHRAICSNAWRLGANAIRTSWIREPVLALRITVW